VINRLRDIADRPVSELPTGLVFAICVLVIALGAFGVAQIADPHSRPQPPVADARDAGPDPNGHEVTNAPAPSWDYGYSELPGEQGSNPVPDTARDAAQVRDATRRFMTGYLAFTYGHARANEIQATSAEMIRGLAQHPPRVPTRIRRLHPRVELVQQIASGPIRAAAVAVIDDDVTRYSVHVELIRNSRSDWIVTEVTGP
jgi:hypothetical protein